MNWKRFVLLGSDKKCGKDAHSTPFIDREALRPKIELADGQLCILTDYVFGVAKNQHLFGVEEVMEADHLYHHIQINIHLTCNHAYATPLYCASVAMIHLNVTEDTNKTLHGCTGVTFRINFMKAYMWASFQTKIKQCLAFYFSS